MARELTRTFNMPTVFEDFFKPFNDFIDMPGTSLWNRVSQLPHVNIVDTKEGYEIQMAAPGFKKEDFNIDVKGNFLTISLEKKEEEETEKKTFTRREFNYYSFTRSFTLPEDVKMDAINARYEDGILKMMLPKKEEAVTKDTKKHIAVL
ncbi:MAG: Hsp20/alpha crystallin family protein [Flavisolibacter sp.]